jgi:hypothetical protein
MFTHSSLSPALLTAWGFLGVVLALGSVTAVAGTGDRAQRPHARRGDWSSHVERQRTEDGYTRNSTFTNAEGQTATRNAVVTNDKDNGTRTRDVTYTGVNGKTSRANTVATRTDTGYTRNTTVTRPNGDSGTREVVIACDKAAGRCTKDVAVISNN